ncbi:ROK family protein [Sphingomonas sp. 10B4]|uniref:ROK family protein n=1 Tax=Sphingomonas sp. 10B4 TaxID=3048575 RepID=UPI002AB52282|nr:ROK family protein [Sphingomonas sp. 10B4]MDY7522833.1 ROK family protein [Sphingomonas sp. 10B4]MEB0284267.1 ROK family protein [Sphingomonas sp. 10B4]
MLDTLLKEGGATQASLPGRLDLSQPSIARLVNGFVAEGIVTSTSRAPTGRGNPSVLLHLSADFAYGIGASLVGDALSMALVDLAGAVRGTRRVALEDRSRAAIVAHIRCERDDLVAAAGIDSTRLVGAGVGFGGFLVDGPLRFNPPAVLADWVDADVPAIMGDAFGLPVLCDNDATTAAIAESLLGVGRTSPTFAFCHLTNGFGGGLIVDGRPMRGALGNAGDFGGVWWLLDQGYPNLERLRVHLAKGGDPFASVEAMLEGITRGMPGIEGWLAEAERPFASLAFLLGHMVSPETVVIGGRLPGWLAERLAARITLPASPPRNDQPFRLPKIVARQVDGDAAAIGAALMPLQALFFA